MMVLITLIWKMWQHNPDGCKHSMLTDVSALIAASGAGLTVSQDNAPVLVTTSFQFDLPTTICRQPGYVLQELTLCG